MYFLLFDLKWERPYFVKIYHWGKLHILLFAIMVQTHVKATLMDWAFII